MADGIRRVYCSSDDRNRVCCALAVCRTEYEIMGISKDLYEAARIDGASSLKTFRFITLPLIKPMFITSLSLNCIGSLKFFDLVYNMTQGGPNNRTQVLATHLYEQGFIYFKYGYSSAIAVVLLVLCLIVSLIIRKGIKVENYEM